LASAVITAILVLVLISPLFLHLVANLSPRNDWELLGLVAQTYGAIAALLTALTLAGLAISLRFQFRAFQVQLEQGARAHYLDLVNLAIANPALIQAGPFAPGINTGASLYTGLWLAQYRSLFTLGQMAEPELRLELEALFRGKPDARKRWETGRKYYEAAADGGPYGEFVRIVDDIYRATDPDPVATEEENG
jgi:hypothetical protein